MSGACTYDLAWIGRCKAPCAGDRCEKHAAIKCASCGEPANRECSHTGQFVCGFPLCANCEGFEDQSKPAGTWGFMNHGHRRKEPRA